MIAVAAPLTQLAATGGAVAAKCNGTGKTCGGVAVFGVALMFAILCGGVFMLLQSNFGLLQGYLISGTAFWASWFVLSLIWFVGVPGIPLSKLRAFKKDIPTSTPRFSGPQGKAQVWLPVAEADSATLATDTNFIQSAGTKRQKDVDDIKAAETAAAEAISKHYAQELGTEPAKITVPGTVLVDEEATQVERSGGGASGIKYVKFTTKPAAPGATATDEEKANIAKIKPATFFFRLDKGSLHTPTYIALPLTFILFALHLFGLMWYERRQRPVGASTRERERETANA